MLAYDTMSAEEIASIDPSQPYPVGRADEILGDALCDLAALARELGIDEEDAFARRSIYYKEFEKPLEPASAN